MIIKDEIMYAITLPPPGEPKHQTRPNGHSRWGRWRLRYSKALSVSFQAARPQPPAPAPPPRPSPPPPPQQKQPQPSPSTRPSPSPSPRPSPLRLPQPGPAYPELRAFLTGACGFSADSAARYGDELAALGLESAVALAAAAEQETTTRPSPTSSTGKPRAASPCSPAAPLSGWPGGPTAPAPHRSRARRRCWAATDSRGCVSQTAHWHGW
jgi:hypothetical protein